MSNPTFLYRAALHSPFPSWVVEQPMPESGEFEKKSSAAFADPDRRLLPIASKSAAFHSAINAFADAESYSAETLTRVKEACAFYDIEGDILPYVELFANEHEKSAGLSDIPEGRYAIDTTLGGQDFKLLPLNDAYDVSDSAHALAKMAAEDRIPFLVMIDAAREVVKAATDHNVDELPEMIDRFGHDLLHDCDRAARLIEGRADLCKDASVREILDRDYREAIAGAEDDPDEAMRKIASIDAAAGLRTNLRVSSLVPTPYDIVFSGPPASAVTKAAKENVLIKDVLVPLAALGSVNERDAEFHLSKEASAQLARARDTDDARDLSLLIENWTDQDQRTLLRLAASSAS